MDQLLILRAQKGDKQALGVLYDYYFPRVYGYIYARIRHRETTEDIVSTIFFKISKYLNKYDPAQNFEVWMFAIAKNTLIDHFKKAKAQYTNELDEDLPDNSYSLETKVEEKIIFDMVLKHLQLLSDIEEQVIRLAYFGQISDKEIAKILNKSHGNIRIIKHRAINRLKQLIDETNGKDD